MVFVCLCGQTSKDILPLAEQKKYHSGKKNCICVAA
jgi:hypothetical protein